MEKLNLYLLLFILPFGTRKFLGRFLDLGEVGSEFSSAFIYATDFLILGLLGFWLLRTLKNKKQRTKNTTIFSQKTSLFLFGFLGVALISVINSSYLRLGAYRLFRLFGFVVLFFYFQSGLRIFERGWLYLVFIGGALFQASVAILQFSFQRSLGLIWLGESPLSPEIDGVAKFVRGGEKIMRGYGTFPHPNLLAQYLFIGFIFLVFLYLRGFFEGSLKQKLFFWGSVFVLELGVLVTFSRAIVFIGILSLYLWGGLLLIIFSKSDVKIKRLFLGISAIGCLLALIFLPYLRARIPETTQAQAITLRSSYNRIALEGIKENPLIGKGLGSFVPELKDLGLVSWKYQPVHNVFYLVGFEAGIFGLGLFILFLFYLSRDFLLEKGLSLEKTTFGLIFVVTFGVMFFDHYLWTIQQGQLIFWFVLALVAFRTK